MTPTTTSEALKVILGLLLCALALGLGVER